jgi:ferredoxin
MKKVAKKEIYKILSQWRKDFTVFAPSREGGVAGMAVWDGKDTGFLDWYRNTVVPPKNSFLLNMEKLFDFHKENDGYKLAVPAPEKPRLIFGIRPCDAKAMAMIDMVFKDTYEDSYYLSKRRNTLLVGLGCTNPYDSCFCTSLGFDGPTDSADVDLMLIDSGEDFLIEEVTDRGKELMAKTKGTAEATQNDENKAKKAKEAAVQKVTRKIDIKEIKEKFPASFENEALWESLAAKCVSCGICTFLCPTCYCFDINDEASRGNGARYRNWDSCSFPLYTKMPMENPREEKWRRVRQKVHHKYTFYPKLFDIIACTGCGRCIRLCPVNWDITQTLTKASAKATGTEK